MWGRGGHLGPLDPKCCLFGQISHFLISGLMLVLRTSLLSPTGAAGASCRNISAEYQHCGIHSDGVQYLDCFLKHRKPVKLTCTWEPGRRTPRNTYTLVIRQQSRSYCKVYSNFTESSKQIIPFNNPITVEVYENAETTNCTKAVFSGSPNSLWRCEPQPTVSFDRHAGKLNVNVTWPKEDAKFINRFMVRYKERGSEAWNESYVKSKDRERLQLQTLNPSTVYVIQIQCDPNDKCSQCPWSGEHTVPSELTTQPIIINVTDTDIQDKPGCRLVSLTWEVPAKEQHKGYNVTIWKESGETPRGMKTLIHHPKHDIRLILSYSAYQFKISAFNNASTSPPVSYVVPERENLTSAGDGKLNVTVHGDDSFTIHWKENLIRKYVCYSVEWRKTGRPALFRSFHERDRNCKTLSSLPEKLEPYTRYRISLHTRPYKDTCNMKHINNSESTYGTTQFYFMEGAPVSAPENVSFSDETVDSVVMQWSSIPEESVRGFLLGYIITYTEYHLKKTSTEHNVTVGPLFNSYKLEDLKSGTAYQVQMCAFTSAGAGVRSAASFFKTNQDGNLNLTGLIVVFSVMATLLLFGSPIIKRAKVLLWPSIPSPGNSNAVQKIDKPCQLELLETTASLKVEEWDTNSFQILEKEDPNPAETSPAMVPLLGNSEDEQEQDSPPMTCSWIQTDPDRAAGDNLPGDTTDTLLDTQRTDVQNSPLTFASDYTTMEMFQQLMPQDKATDSRFTAAIEDEPEDLTERRSVAFDYVRQFSTSPPSDSEHMSTVVW